MKESTKNNPFAYSDSNKRYYSYDYFLRTRFGGKVAKISLDLGCTCPNIDATKGIGGCTYCSPRGSGDFAGCPEKPVSEQFANVAGVIAKKWPDAKYIAYRDKLMREIENALYLPNVVGISVATRADCIDNGWADFFRKLSSETYLCVELGLQTVFDETALRINRCHSFADFVKGYDMLSGVDRVVHLINGLPGETHEMMVTSAKTVGEMRPHALKIHLLHVLKHTPLEKEYLNGTLRVLSRDEYVSVVCDQLERLPPETVIERVTGDGSPDDLIAPDWSRKKLVVMNEIDKELVRRNSMQGKYFKSN